LVNKYFDDIKMYGTTVSVRVYCITAWCVNLRCGTVRRGKS